MSVKTSTMKKTAISMWGMLATLLAVYLVAAFAIQPASAAPGDSVWVAKHDSAIVNESTVILNGGNTSVEAANLGVEVEANAVVTFYYGLDAGATCTAGAPRVFMQVGEVYHNSWDQNIGAGTQCGTDGKVTFTLPEAGTVKHAGVVYDNSQPGTVLVSKLSIGEVEVNFKEKEPTPTPTPTESNEPSPTATPTVLPTTSPRVDPTPTAEPSATETTSPSSSPTVVPTTTSAAPEPSETMTSQPVLIPADMSTDSGNLPRTGSSFIPGLALFGAVLMGGGALLFYISRKRRLEV